MKGLSLYLTYVSYERVEFRAYVDGRQFDISVINGMFPHMRNEHGLTLGDDQLDYEVCLRADEELARLRSYQLAFEAA